MWDMQLSHITLRTAQPSKIFWFPSAWSYSASAALCSILKLRLLVFIIKFLEVGLYSFGSVKKYSIYTPILLARPLLFKDWLQNQKKRDALLYEHDRESVQYLWPSDVKMLFISSSFAFYSAKVTPQVS